MANPNTEKEYAVRSAGIIAQAETVSVQVALGGYLNKFTLEEIQRAHPESTVKNVLHVWNRCRNLQLGSWLGYDLDRLPVTTQAEIKKRGDEARALNARDFSTSAQ